MQRHIARTAAVAFVIGLFGQSAFAQDDELVERAIEDDIEVVIVGSRAASRPEVDSTVPVDAVGVDALLSQSSANMSDLLRTVVPSFHVSVNPSRDSAALMRPVNLRGLAPDHTLVLVDNKRRHRGAVIQWISNGASDGAQGPDIASIPAIALRRVEVLRDGAAAQYGSDAIAGVLNFVLKNASEGGSLDVKWGAHSHDGAEDMATIAGNIGLPLSQRGFLNLSAEFSQSAPTDRSVQHPDAAALQALGLAGVADPAKPWGNPNVMDSIKLLANLGVQATDATQFYGYGNFSSRQVETPFFYRPPQGRRGVYVEAGSDTLLVGGAPGCKARYAFDATAANVLAVHEQLRADNDCFAFAEILPAGFTPSFGAEVADASAVAGVRGALPNGFGYDLYATWGRNEVDFYLDDTVNASHGPNTPRSFDIGEYLQIETNVHADFVYPVDVGLATDLNIAAGLEWREERFDIVTGERASWDTGPYGVDGFAARSNGFGGFNPASSGSWRRANVAAYLDLEADVTERLRLGGAVRWEDFDGFGAVTNHKLTGRVQLTYSLALRGAYGTGYRAPTPGQQNASNLATVVDSATGEFREQGTIASSHPVAAALGGGLLDPETSQNYTFGIVVEGSNGMVFTVDWFRVDLDDRLALSSNLEVTDAIRETLRAGGVSNPELFNRVRFFTNDFSTETSGIDVVLGHGFGSAARRTDWTLRVNRASTELTAFAASSTASRRRALEEGVPEMRISASVVHSWQRWRLSARYNHYGEWFDTDDGTAHDGYGLLDLALEREFGKARLSLGADNVLDAYPDEAVRSPSSGRLYPRYSPAGYNGRVVYGRLRYLF